MAQVKNDNILVRAPKPVDEREGFWLNGVWVLFESPEQALANPDVLNYRHIGMTIPIYYGTTQVEYWFYGGITDEDFVLKSSGSGVATTSGEIALGDPRLIINWNDDLVPTETITWFEKHGALEDVVIQTERPNPLPPDFTEQEVIDHDLPVDSEDQPTFFEQTLNAQKSTDFNWLILDNGGDTMRWLIFSKGTVIEPPPPSEGFPFDFPMDFP